MDDEHDHTIMADNEIYSFEEDVDDPLLELEVPVVNLVSSLPAAGPSNRNLFLKSTCASSTSSGSAVKKYFSKNTNQDGKKCQFVCLVCNVVVLGENTSNLWSHLKNKHFNYYLICWKEKEAKKKKQQMLTAGKVTSSTESTAKDKKDSDDELIGCSEGGQSSALSRKRPAAGENRQELKSKTKQLSILESFGTRRLNASTMLGYIKDLFLTCQSASLKILDAPSFQQIVVSACPNNNLFTSQELIENFRAEYHLKYDRFVSALSINNDAVLTLGVETHIHDLKKFLLGSIYFCYEEKPIQKVVVSTKELRDEVGVDMMSTISDWMSYIIDAEIFRGRIALILVDNTEPGLQEAALIAGSEAVPLIPIVVCLSSALQRAWKTVLQHTNDLEFFKQCIAPLLKLTKCEQFLLTLTEDEKVKVRGFDTDELFELVIDHHTELASHDTTERAEALSRSELKTARELVECLKKLKKVLASSIIQPNQVHLSMWMTLKNLFAAFLTDIKTKSLSREAKELSEFVGQEIESCFFTSDVEFSAFVSLLDYRVKNDQTMPSQIRAEAIRRLERELSQSTSRNASNTLAEKQTKEDKGDGFLESFWTQLVAERAITNTNVSRAHFGMSHTLKSYMEESMVPLNMVDMHSAWFAKRGHPLFKIAQKYFSVICQNSMKVVVPHRDICSDDIQMMTFLANYPANL
ncbi:uncharacterized protein LOC135947991 [Cloeon dipterum]|uniref:uncharacterized protein LOC135947991 n=1 Tax=Cloeon dipterum TaxID=197152 RepID=UPI00322083F4